ncbi:MAG: aminotransferase class I/II-fold pyridoxal phosphate-dependent enzyme [Magnetococcales bacterium]|uniref:Aminotransferase class I/II-fold pyridoxal phosphate-dependent enzyme n=1 Tax=Candidatus Magnetobacterium casense TaxID=1455061 RepID=A0ABS6S2H5_9BACT|nr:aminotransferase class I/II-fold pyridoxal phosphate-dependent enzyme [Candidatus Magnetobacterium casensis]MBF0608841.1 aminotransferase class I/II-fold pyridoxal phosphate-dependent enzyme [Nitrospirota bacterium]MBV6342790.1 aminotransferase class I/II-fold pyridoxal phosphate-dependent enzyme [Candidatus Magnetobacterium casensis]
MLKRLDDIAPFMAMDIARQARQFPDTVHMELGEPDLPPPPAVVEGVQRAMTDNRYAYTPALGLKELRKRIAQHYNHKYGVDVSSDRVIVTPGTSGAFLVALGIALNAGDVLCLPDPSYPCYKNFAHYLDITPTFIPVDKDTSFELTPEALQQTKDINALLISSPANPTGRLYNTDNLKALIQHCNDKSVTFISDEIYHGLVYGATEHTALEFSDNVIVINGFSKSFCMPGFRIGWMIVPEDWVRRAEIVISSIFIAANTIAQYAACEAFDYTWLADINKTFAHRRDFLYGGLRGLFDLPVLPDGAFYVWADISRYVTGNGNSPGVGMYADSVAFAQALLQRRHVAITPGVDFGRNATHHHVRLTCTSPIDVLQRGIDRIKDFLL